MDDVMCCARVILNGGARDTTPGRPEPNVAVEIGEAAWEAGGLQVPVHVRGAERLGAARLDYAPHVQIVYEANLAFLVLSRARGTGERLARAASGYCEGRPGVRAATLRGGPHRSGKR